MLWCSFAATGRYRSSSMNSAGRVRSHGWCAATSAATRGRSTRSSAPCRLAARTALERWRSSIPRPPDGKLVERDRAVMVGVDLGESRAAIRFGKTRP